jgi:hypothetical protein
MRRRLPVFVLLSSTLTFFARVQSAVAAAATRYSDRGACDRLENLRVPEEIWRVDRLPGES